MNSVSKDDFYMVLPSNASPNTHPKNNASDFIVSWENEIHLDPEDHWTVAMTEMNYVYKPSTTSPRYSINYEKFDFLHSYAICKIYYNPTKNQIEHKYWPHAASPLVPEEMPEKLYINNKGNFQIISKFKFTIKMPEDLFVFLGFKANTAKSVIGEGNFTLISNTPAKIEEFTRIYNKNDEGKYYIGDVTIEAFRAYTKHGIFRFDTHDKFESEQQFATFLKAKCS